MGRDTDGDTGMLAASVAQCRSTKRYRVLRELQRGERRNEALKAATELAAAALSEVLAELRERGLIEERTTELDLLETEYTCSQELTGTVPEPAGQPVETHYALTPEGEAFEPVFEAGETWASNWLAERPENPCITAR